MHSSGGPLANLQLQLQMKPKRVVDLLHDPCRDSPEETADTLDCDRSHLLGLRLGIHLQPSFGGGQQGLERKYLCGVAGDGDDRHHAATQARGRAVGAIVAHDDRWVTLIRFAASRRFQVDESYLTSEHL
jgi:hypothetical protein